MPTVVFIDFGVRRAKPRKSNVGCAKKRDRGGEIKAAHFFGHVVVMVIKTLKASDCFYLRSFNERTLILKMF